MNFATVAAGGTLSEGQIQKNIEKIRFRIVAGAKAAATAASAQLMTEAASVVVTLKRISQELGEKTIWPRVKLSELINATLGIEGYASTTGTDAATAFDADVSIEVSMLGNIAVQGGDYLALTVENGSAVDFLVDTVSSAVSGKDHLKLTKISLQPDEVRRVQIDRAEFVTIPTTVSEARLVGDDTVTLNSNSLEGYLNEKSSFIANFSGGTFRKPSAATMPANNIDYIDFVNGNTAANILIFRQTEY